MAGKLRKVQKELGSLFSGPAVTRSFRKFSDHLVYHEDARGRHIYLPPYVPFVGTAYDKGRILVYAKAQNLARYPNLRKEYYELGANAMYRLCRRGGGVPQSYKDLDIRPVSCGVLPALAGVYLYAVDGLEIGSLDAVTSRLAITNFYKFSLWNVRRSPVNDSNQQDLNPDSYAGVKEYARLTLEQFVGPEIERLKPRAILCLKRYGASMLESRYSITGPAVWAVNDPAWILRGGGRGGCLKPTGSWGKLASRQKDPGLRRMVDSYCRQIRENRSKGYSSKLKAIAVYLKCYYAKFRSALGADGAASSRCGS